MAKQRYLDNEFLEFIKEVNLKGKMNQIEEEKEVKQVIKGQVKYGLIISIVVIIFFFLWGGLAPLDSAAISHGTIVFDSYRKTIQHLEGGIITEIKVKEGQEVKTGDTLIVLNQASSKASLELLLKQMQTAKASEARLISEIDGKDKINFDDESITKNMQDPAVIKIIDGQNLLFKSRTSDINGKIEVLKQRNLQLSEQIKGLEAQKSATIAQQKFIHQELINLRQLFKEGLVIESRLIEQERKAAELEGSLGQYISEIAKIKDSMTETDLQIINVKNEFNRSVMEELKETQAIINEVNEKMQASSDILKRTVITSPINGKVTGLKYHTIGGVITPGVQLMDIVPKKDELIVESRINVNDIDIVHEGLSAKVMLSAFRNSFFPKVTGKVIYVSGDSFNDDKTGQPYFLAKILLDEKSVKELPKNVKLYPGMPAEVFVKTGETTILNYLMNPIILSLQKSFRDNNGI